MIFRIFYSYTQRHSEGGCPTRIETSKVIDADNANDINIAISEIKSNNDCGYRTHYIIGDIVRIDCCGSNCIKNE